MDSAVQGFRGHRPPHTHLELVPAHEVSLMAVDGIQQ